MPGPAQIPVLWCVDVEPDDFVFPPDHPSPWRGFEMLVEETRRLRPRLQEVTGEPARFTWFVRMDPQIALGYGASGWALTHLHAVFEKLRECGDAVGIHPHAWRWDRDRHVWISDHADQAWVDHCLEVSVEAYRDAFGDAPVYQRFGNRFMSTSTMNLARTLGVRLDLTVEPGESSIGPGEFQGGEWIGETPDFADAPRVPYQPDPSDFLRPSEGRADGLWAIPLTSGRVILKDHPVRRRWGRLRWHSLPKALDRARHPARTVMGATRRVRAGTPAPSTARSGTRSDHQTLSIWRDWRSPRDFWDSAFEGAGELESPYLAFAIRSDTPLRRDLHRRMDGILRHLLQDPRAGRLVFTTPEDTLRRLGLMRENQADDSRAGSR
jgi:hypothetical protein